MAPKSVRLGRSLELRLAEAARITGKPASRLIREAVEERCDALLKNRLDIRLADFIGCVASKKRTNASRIEEEFGRILDKKFKRSSRKKR